MILRLIALAVVALLLVAAPVSAQPPATLGWATLANTALRPINAGDCGNIGMESITAAWNSSIMDRVRNRMVFWGGGHNDGCDNSVYAIKITDGTRVRLSNPTTPIACVDNWGGSPNVKHTYGTLTMIEHTDEMLAPGVSSYCDNGTIIWSFWTFSFATNTWTLRSPTGDTMVVSGSEAAACAYNPIDQNVYCFNPGVNGSVYRYNRNANTLTRLTNSAAGATSSGNGAFDRKRQYFYYIGGGAVRRWQVANANPVAEVLSTSGCGAMTGAINGGGLDYSDEHDRIGAWDGSNTVTFFNTVLNSCTAQTWTGAPTRIINGQYDNGVYGRWRYSPTSRVFAYYGDVDTNLNVLRVQLAPDADFASRCNASGVTNCIQPVASDLVLNTTIFAGGGSPSTTPILDPTQLTSGTGSLRLRQTAGCTSTECGGAALFPFNMNCGPGTTCYWQYRFRISSAMISNGPSGNWDLWKWSIVHGVNTKSCSAIELTGETYPDPASKLFRMYTECGGNGLYTLNQDPAFIYNGAGNTIQQSAQSGLGFNCQFPSFPVGTGNGTGCFRIQADTWYTFDGQLIFGSYGAANSTLRAWVTPQGSTTRLQLLELRNFRQNFQDTPADPGYNVMRWIVYRTGGFGSTPATADAWYSELIVSTQPIALPGAGAAQAPAPSPPASPFGLEIRTP